MVPPGLAGLSVKWSIGWLSLWVGISAFMYICMSDSQSLYRVLNAGFVLICLFRGSVHPSVIYFLKTLTLSFIWCRAGKHQLFSGCAGVCLFVRLLKERYFHGDQAFVCLSKSWVVPSSPSRGVCKSILQPSSGERVVYEWASEWVNAWVMLSTVSVVNMWAIVD